MIDTRVVGAYISELRRDADMTQAEMANRLNVTHQAVSKWENGLALPDVQTLVDLAELFGVSVDQILSAGDKRHHPASAPTAQSREDVVASARSAGAQSASAQSAGAQSAGAEDPQSDSSSIARGTKQGRLDLNMLSELAPFMSRETVDRIFEKACAGEVNADQIMKLAPFVSREQLEKAVDMVADDQLSAHHLCSLAPFVGREVLRKAVRKVQDGSLDSSILMALAPFLGADLIDELIHEIIGSD